MRRHALNLQRTLPWHGAATRLRRAWRARPWLRWSVLSPLALVALLAVVLGGIGFAGVNGADGTALGALQVAYRTLRLFTLNLDVPDGTSLPWMLWIAAFLAPLTTVTLIARLARERLRTFAMRRLLRGHVVVCGIGVRGAHMVRARTRDGGLVVAIDIDEGALHAWAADTWTVTGDATAREILESAGVQRAAEVIVITADDYRNAAVASAIGELTKELAPGEGPEVYVHLDDPAMARILPQSPGGSSPPAAAESDGAPSAGGGVNQARFVSFSTAARAAAVALVGPGTDGWMREAGGSRRTAKAEAPRLAIFGDDPLIDAMLLELHRRWEASNLDGESTPMRPTVLLFGEAATARVQVLARRHGKDWTSLELCPHDLDLDPSAPVGAEVLRQLRATPAVQSAWVVDRSQLAGLQVAHAVARALGNEATVRMVSEAPIDEFAAGFASRTTDDRTMAEVKALSVVELALGDGDLSRNRRAWRLAKAQMEHAGRTADPSPTDCEEAAAALARAGVVIDDPTPASVPWEGPILAALGLPAREVFLRAGLRVDTLAFETARHAGPRLLAAIDRAERPSEIEAARALAFTYYARVAGAVGVDGVAALGELHSGASLAGTPARSVAADATAADVTALLALCRTVIERRQRRLDDGAIAAHTPASETELTPAHQRAEQFAIIAGGAASWDGEAGSEHRAAAVAHLTEAVTRPPWNATLISGGTPSGISGIVGALPGVRRRGYCPATNDGRAVITHEGYDDIVRGLRDGFSIADPLRAWADLIGREIDPEDVPVLVYPGGPITRQEVALAHALGAHVGVVELPGDDGSDALRTLYADWDRVTPLSNDPMVVRAFLRAPTGVGITTAQCWQLAEEIHESYRAKQLAAGVSADDPSCVPWSRLASGLRHSNWAQAAHIPVKLEALGWELCPPDAGVRLDLDLPFVVNTDQPFPRADLERLARMEHGRWAVERVRRGWQDGTRAPLKLLTHCLVPWEALPPVEQAKDRDTIVGLPALIDGAGLAVKRPGETSAAQPSNQSIAARVAGIDAADPR